jgi:hypothetical protein
MVTGSQSYRNEKKNEGKCIMIAIESEGPVLEGTPEQCCLPELQPCKTLWMSQVIRNTSDPLFPEDLGPFKLICIPNIRVGLF